MGSEPASLARFSMSDLFWQPGMMVGERGRVSHQPAQTQADYPKEVISSQHAFLDDDQSLEDLPVRGPASLLKDLYDALRRVRGVHQLQLATTTALVPPLYEQEAGDKARGAMT